MKKPILVALIAFNALLIGCSSVPMTPVSQDADGKKFQPESGKANIYLARKKRFFPVGSFALSEALVQTVMDGRIIGSVAEGTYQLMSVNPGEHTLTTAGLGYNEDPIKVQAEAGKNYFFKIEVRGAWGGIAASFSPLNAQDGQSLVQALKRAETATYTQ